MVKADVQVTALRLLSAGDVALSLLSAQGLHAQLQRTPTTFLKEMLHLVSPHRAGDPACMPKL